MVVNTFTNFNLVNLVIITLWLLKDTSLQSRSKINFCDEVYACKVNETKIQHTICALGHNCGEGPNCKNFKPAPLSKNEKESVLDAHNFYRNKIATGQVEKSSHGIPSPKAPDMRELVWDDELEFLAQCWANQCPEGHDKCRTKSDGSSVAQNLAFSAEEDAIAMTGRFYNEISAFSLSNITESNQSSHKVDRFAKMIWPNSSELGCARSSYDIGVLGTKQRYVLICHYSWGEDAFTLSAYKEGEACTRCPKGSQCHKKYNGLCTTQQSTADAPDICPYSTDNNCAPLLEKNLEHRLKRMPRANSGSTHKTPSTKGSTTKITPGTVKPRIKPKTEYTDIKSKSTLKTPKNKVTVILERKIIVVTAASGITKSWTEKCLSVVYSVYYFIILFCNKIL